MHSDSGRKLESLCRGTKEEGAISSRATLERARDLTRRVPRRALYAVAREPRELEDSPTSSAVVDDAGSLRAYV